MNTQSPFQLETTSPSRGIESVSLIPYLGKPLGLLPKTRTYLYPMKTITRYFRKKFGNDHERQCCEITCDVCGSKTTARAGVDAIRMLDQSCQQCINIYGQRKAYELHNPQQTPEQ